MNCELITEPSVALMNKAPPRLAVFCMKLSLLIVIPSPSYQLIAPPSSAAVLFSKYDFTILIDIYSSCLQCFKNIAPPRVALFDINLESCTLPPYPDQNTAPPRFAVFVVKLDSKI